MQSSLAPAILGLDDIIVRVAVAPEEHNLYVVESAEPLPQELLMHLKRHTANKLCNDRPDGSKFYPSTDPAKRPHALVYLAVGDYWHCVSDAGALQQRLRSMANHPAHT